MEGVTLNIEKLRKLINEGKVSQTKLATEIQCEPGTINYLLSGRQKTCKWEVVYGIAKYFGLKMDDFVIDKN